MASSFTWLDHSDKERRKVLEAIDRFKETDTRDELGIGAVRDAFAEHFFPGTGVLMTRARYFLFVPWMYQELERKRSRADAGGRARKAEIQLIKTLGAQEGTIGRRAKDALKRLPSNIYWLGSGIWGLRLFDGTQTEYHRALATTPAVVDLLGDEDDATAGSARNWHASLPQAPEEFPAVADFALTLGEASYLQERIRLNAPDSLLAMMFRSDVPDVPFAWSHPSLGHWSAELRSELHHAHCFAEVMQGAALLYNLLLAEAAKHDTVSHFREELAKWRVDVGARARELAAWDLAAFWRTVRSLGHVRDATVRFVNEWTALRPWENTELADDDAARRLVRTRERNLKGARARLGNPRALELWGGRSGTGRLEFRWRTAQRLVADILEGLEQPAVASA